MCIQCENTGWLSAIHTETLANYAFRCSFCSIAQQIRLSSKIPMWPHIPTKEYEIYRDFLGRGGFFEHEKRLKESEIAL